MCNGIVINTSTELITLRHYKITQYHYFILSFKIPVFVSLSSMSIRKLPVY